MQLAAVLNGDHTKDIYPDKLVEEMTVAEAAEYATKAFNNYHAKCEQCITEGMDGCHIPIVDKPDANPSGSQLLNVLACFGCGGHGGSAERD